jgi:hypothetical protein
MMECDAMHMMLYRNLSEIIGKYEPSVVVSQKQSDGKWVEAGRTEIVK